MNRQPPARTDRRTMAAYVGGAVTAAGALGFGVLVGQALIARFTIPGAEAPPPRCDGDYGTRYASPGAQPIRLAVIGDSTAAGYGVRTRAQTPGALLSTWIADAAQRPVRLTCPAVVGSVSAWLAPQVETAIEAGVDVAVIFIGANDVTARSSESAAVRHLYEAVRALRAADAQVVVATCPDLGTIRPIQPPLRWLARRWSRQLAAAQAVAAVSAGGRAVPLGELIGPQFDAAPERMFGQDRYHPSIDGYRASAFAVLPTALATLGIDDGFANLVENAELVTAESTDGELANAGPLPSQPVPNAAQNTGNAVPCIGGSRRQLLTGPKSAPSADRS